MFQDQPSGCYYFYLRKDLFYTLVSQSIIWTIIRMWVLQSQGLDYRKRSSNPFQTHKRRVHDSLEEFLLASKEKAQGEKVDLEAKSKDQKVDLKIKNEGVKGLGPQHAELLVRLHKLCSKELASLMILKLCNLEEEQRVVIGQEVKACPDEMVSRLVERLNGMEKEQMDFVLDTERELAKILQEIVNIHEKENIEQ